NEYLTDYLPAVDQRASIIREAMEYSLSAGGKRIRPVLLMSSCEFAGGDSLTALPYACAIEFIHTYSLIHDDLPAMDNDELRRGKPTNHMVYGDGMATLAGDGLLNSAFEIMAKDMMMHFGNAEELQKRINAMYTIAKGAGVRGMIAGQAADIEAEAHDSADNNTIKFIHGNKTVALIVSAVQAGLYLGGADKSMFDAMTKYAENLGLAFQIADDILDVRGVSDVLGKNVGSDAAKEKLTYVSLNGIEESEKRLRVLTDNAVESIAPYYDNAEFFKQLVLELAERTY
ncbi:MAG: polyprenyl synthetase family protein, partial [Firmicutes bacterium]|nr:polyprenyl synthetase family protein [Bacillota bacterium]